MMKPLCRITDPCLRCFLNIKLNLCTTVGISSIPRYMMNILLPISPSKWDHCIFRMPAQDWAPHCINHHWEFLVVTTLKSLAHTCVVGTHTNLTTYSSPWRGWIRSGWITMLDQLVCVTTKEEFGDLFNVVISGNAQLVMVDRRWGSVAGWYGKKILLDHPTKRKS